MSEVIPPGYVLVRTTDVFTQDSVPAGLLRAHRIASGVWGRLVVRSGSLRFVFDSPDDVDHATTVNGGEQGSTVAAAESVIIPPAEPHHLEIDGPVSFVVEFYRSGEASSG